MISIKTLDRVSLDQLYVTFLKAFSDYEVDAKLTFEQFMKMMEQRGTERTVSIGAFDGDTLVGIMLVGLRKWNDEMTAYDVCTGVIKEYRNQKITSGMFKEIKKYLKEKNVRKYMLEVIKTNEPAVHLYKKQGFEVSRELNCFWVKKEELNLEVNNKSVCSIHTINEIDEAQWDEFKSFWDVNPSWQDSIDSIKVIREDVTCAAAVVDGQVIGYGIMCKRNGDIMQLAVDKDYRNMNIGKSLIIHLVSIDEGNGLSVVNIDSRCDSLKGFLNSLGFKDFVDQYEMVLKI